MLQKANYGAVCSESVVLPGLLAGHELTVPSQESSHTAVTIHCHKCPAHERGGMDVSHAGPGQVSFQPFVKAPSQAAEQCLCSIQQKFAVRCSLLPLQGSFWLWYLRYIYSRCSSLSCCCLKSPQNLIISLGSGEIEHFRWVGVWNHCQAAE